MHVIVRQTLTSLVVACVVCYGAGALAAMATPTDQIRSGVDEVLAIQRDTGLQSETRRQSIRDAIEPHFDYRAMGAADKAANLGG